MGYEREMSARQKALELNKRKDAIEAEIDAIVSSLTENGGPGMTGNLIDAEGFPRADIDIHGVRSQRNRYAVLRTDHEKITSEIEKYLYMALAPPAENAAGSGSSEPTPPVSTTTVTPDIEAGIASSTTEPATSNGPAMPAPSEPRRPAFAKVDIVSENSPAAAAGVVLNDKIVSFGAVSLRTFATPQLAMQALPGLLREHENQSLDVIVERGEDDDAQNTTLSLTPRKWSGAGLLGCHVVPLEVSQVDGRYAPEVATAFMQHARPGHI